MSAHPAGLFPVVATAFLILGFGAPSGSRAEWVPDGIPACQAAGRQRSPQIIADEDGGVIVAWEDTRFQYEDIYAQRIDATGKLLWTIDGVAVCDAFPWQRGPAIVTDGSNGAIIAWDDLRIGNAEIYAQRIDAAGVPVWARNGVPVCTSLPHDAPPVAVSDGARGAIIAWLDMREIDPGLYAQRIDDSGILQWKSNGVPVCTVPGGQRNPRMIPDDSGGAFLVWEEFRNGALSNDLYAQHIAASGDAFWTRNGLLVSTAEGQKESVQFLADEAGGVLITWQTYASGLPQVRVQRLDGSGNRLWGDDGLAVCPVRSGQQNPEIAADGGGGLVVAWEDNRNSSESDVYAQRFDASGEPLWLVEGVALCTAPGRQWLPRLVALGNGGVIAVWGDSRLPGLFDSSIYAQRLNAAGEMLWATGGVAVCTKQGFRNNHRIVSTQAGANIVVWDDQRNDRGDIYAQRLETLTATVVQEFSVLQTSSSLKLRWRLAPEAEQNLESIGIQKAPSARGPWTRVATLRRGDPIQFEDFEVRRMETYWYSLLLVGWNGRQESTSPEQVEFQGGGGAWPTSLMAPHVSPEGRVELRYSLSAPLPIRLELFDVNGRRLQVFDHGTRESGEYHLTWDRSSASGIRVPAGIYVVRLLASREVYSRKVALLR